MEGRWASEENRSPDFRRLRQRAAEGKSSEFIWGTYTQTCPNCEAKNIPEYFEFCGACGAELNGAE